MKQKKETAATLSVYNNGGNKVKVFVPENEDKQKQINNVSVEMLLEALKPFAEMFGEFTSTKIRQGGTVFQYNDKHLTIADFEKAEQVINYLSHHPIK